jgi:hypothetical protein
MLDTFFFSIYLNAHIIQINSNMKSKYLIKNHNSSQSYSILFHLFFFFQTLLINDHILDNIVPNFNSQQIVLLL